MLILNTCGLPLQVHPVSLEQELPKQNGFGVIIAYP